MSLSENNARWKKHTLEKDILEYHILGEDILEKDIPNILWCVDERALKNGLVCVRMMRGENTF